MSKELTPRVSFARPTGDVERRRAMWEDMRRSLGDPMEAYRGIEPITMGYDPASLGGDMSALVYTTKGGDLMTLTVGPEIMTSWIDRDAAKVDPRSKLEREVRAHRGAVERAGYLERIISPPTPQARSRPTSRPRVTAPKPDRLAELRRLESGPQHWTCSIRDELLAEGLVEITFRGDGRWAGDQLTAKGRALLA